MLKIQIASGSGVGSMTLIGAVTFACAGGGF